MSPTAIRCLKAGLNAETDGMTGLQELAGQATSSFTAPTRRKKAGTPSLKNVRPYRGHPWLP